MPLTKTKRPGSNRDAGIALTWTAATGSAQEIAFSKGDIILARNVHGSTGFDVTIKSAASRAGRLNDIAAHEIAAGTVYVYGPFNQNGWMQLDGNLDVIGEAASIEFAIISTEIAPPA